MEIKQFEDKGLAHYSYALVSNGEIALIDPARNPQPYYDFAKQHQAKITTVIETHPHADFVSGHAEIARTTGATIYVSKLLGAEYPHQTFDEDDTIMVGNTKLQALNTPGHSPDSICIIVQDEQGKPVGLFSGDTLFIGDCGRPDLRESAGAITAAREELAKAMYHSLRNKLIGLPNDVKVYPAHGAGSLCGRGLSSQNSSTMGAEKISNWSLQEMSETEFVKALLEGQPFVPKYFGFDVMLNKKGADNYLESISGIQKHSPITDESMANMLDPNIPVIDARPDKEFKKSYLKNSYNLMKGGKFETWLGSIIGPGESFYLAASNDDDLNSLIAQIAKIGYEKQIKMAFVLNYGNTEWELFDDTHLKEQENSFTIVDVRNVNEVKEGKLFENALNIPLPELRERVHEIPLNKPIVVHCAAGYRSAAATSIIKASLNGDVKVYDLGEAVNHYK
ncbi:MAG: MBL fold metallo-hydrolase [Bacteroidetes bacterium]|nr:MBL fold metallo-hydrolase [Bacteroidota bacterium]